MLTLKHKLIFLSLISSIIVTGLPSMALAASCEDSTQTGLQKCLVGNPIVKDLNIIVDFLSIGVGIVVIGSIILGGIQYAMAGDSPEAVNKAKQRITNASIALLAYMFVFAFLQWLIPGGIFNS
jgi:hypothetical protein